jgi:Nucleotidyltransferase of unknown function (DUF6036)
VNKDDIEKYLRMLGDELLKRNVTGEILLVGGAVMLLEVGNREITKDIDDARALIEKLHLSDAQEVFALIEKYTKKERVEPRTQYIVEELFDS